MGVQSVQLSSTGFIPNTTGLGSNLSQQTPEFSLIQTSDTLATVLVSGYLNKSRTAFQYPYVNNQMALVSTTDQGDVWLKISVSTSGGVGTYSLVYPAGEGGSALSFTGTISAGNILRVANPSGVLVDTGIAAANLMQLNTANTMAAGGSIVLLKANGTEAGNAVTADGQCGVITTSSLTTAGGASYAITWTNTSIATTSVINLTIMGGTNTTEAITLKATAGAGTSTLTIYNNTAATALNGTIFIGYTVF